MECKVHGWPVSVSAIYPGTVLGDEGLGEEVRKLTSKEDWDYIIKTFGSTTLVAQAEAVIRAVNYDEPELFSVEPNPKAGVILGDIFPRMGDFLAKNRRFMSPVWKWLSHLADVQGD